MNLTEVQEYSVSHLVLNPFSSTWSDDHKMAVMTEKGVHILALAPNPTSLWGTVGFSRQWIKVDTSLPTSDVGINAEELIWHLKKKDAYKLVLDTNLAPVLPKATPLIPCVKAVAWSPLGILHDQRCILATLTNMGGLSLYRIMNMEWVEQTSVSKSWVEYCKHSWGSDNILSLKGQVKELKRRAIQAKITAMCWSRSVYNSTSLFFTGTRSGQVVIWQVSSNKKYSIKLKVLHVYRTNMKMIGALHWHMLSDSSGLLLVADYDGILKCFHLSKMNVSFTVEKSHFLWSEYDKMKISYINCWEWKSRLLVVVAKEAFVLVFFIDYSGQLVCHNTYRCCDTLVSGMVQLTQDSVLMTTRSGRFTHFSFSIVDNNLQFDTQRVENYMNLSQMACYGISMSYNKVICAVVLSVNQIYDHLILREPSLVLLCILPELINPQAILKSSVQPLRTMWDCLEVLRIQTFYKTYVPEIEWSRAVLDTFNMDKLMRLLWLITFAVTVEEDESRLVQLKNLRFEIEMLVLSCHLFKRIATLLSNKEKLTKFQLKTLGLLKKWLKHMTVLHPDYKGTLVAASSMMEQVEALGDFVPVLELCDICKAEVPELNDHLYSVCTNGHKLPRCVLNLVQCSQAPYYTCSQCGVIADKQSVEECGLYCVFCDGTLTMDGKLLSVPDNSTASEI